MATCKRRELNKQDKNKKVPVLTSLPLVHSVTEVKELESPRGRVKERQRRKKSISRERVAEASRFESKDWIICHNDATIPIRQG